MLESKDILRSARSALVKAVRRFWLLDEEDCDVGNVNCENDREDSNVNKKAAMFL
jgi:hypothetical protein